MVRKPNYDFDKRRKELDRKARKEAKRAERQQRRDGGQQEDAPTPETSPPSVDQSGIGPPAD